MLTSLRLVNFKNFADETLKLGPFTVIVGANASGKSNIRDAFRFLHGIGRGYTLAEIMGGKIGAGGQTEWEGIRGAPNEVGRIRNKFNLPHATFSIDASIDPPNGEPAAYSVSVWFDSFGPHGYRVTNESLVAGSKTIFTTMEAGEPLGDMLWLEFGEDAIWQFHIPLASFSLHWVSSSFDSSHYMART